VVNDVRKWRTLLVGKNEYFIYFSLNNHHTHRSHSLSNATRYYKGFLFPFDSLQPPCVEKLPI